MTKLDNVLETLQSPEFLRKFEIGANIYGVLVLLIVAAIVGYTLYSQEQRETQLQGPKKDTPRYIRRYPMRYILTFFLIALLITPISLVVMKPIAAVQYIVALIINLCIDLSVLYALLLIFNKKLRERFSARTCANLWLVPLFFAFMQVIILPSFDPIFEVKIPNTAAWIILGVWFVGFVFVMLRAVLQHRKFRKEVFKRQIPLVPQYVTDVWKEEWMLANPGKMYRTLRRPVIISRAVQTPMALDFFERYTRVVLPEREYTEDELHLIFRHELVHIGREDPTTKFYLTLITAMYWFDPLVWLGVRRALSDVELGCDETALIGADTQTRRDYAELILTTACDNGGFTSCLSARAESLRYRLKNVVSNEKRRNGGFIIALVLFLFMLNGGIVRVGFDLEDYPTRDFEKNRHMFNNDPHYTAEEAVFYAGDISEYEVVSFEKHLNGEVTEYEMTDFDGFTEYMCSLDYWYYGNKGNNADVWKLIIVLEGPEGQQRLVMTDHGAQVTPLYETKLEKRYYRINPILDRDLILSFASEK